jgi:hypothetical protein
MRQKHNRASRPIVVFSSEAWRSGFEPALFDGSISITQTIPFVLSKMSKENNTITGVITGNKSSTYDEFRCGSCLVSSEKIDVTKAVRIGLRGDYSFTEGETYGEYHFRRIYLALLSETNCYVNAAGMYLSHSSEPTSTNAVPHINLDCDPGESGKIHTSLDVSALTGSYYLSTMMLIKASSVTGTLKINSLWIE